MACDCASGWPKFRTATKQLHNPRTQRANGAWTRTSLSSHERRAPEKRKVACHCDAFCSFVRIYGEGRRELTHTLTHIRAQHRVHMNAASTLNSSWMCARHIYIRERVKGRTQNTQTLECVEQPQTAGRAGPPGAAPATAGRASCELNMHNSMKCHG